MRLKISDNRMMVIDKGVAFNADGEKYIAQEFPSNNGNFKAVDAEGRMRWFNTVTDDIKVQENAL